MKTCLRISQLILSFFLAAMVTAGICFQPERLSTLVTAGCCVLLFLLGLTLRTSFGELAMEIVHQVREDLEVPVGTGSDIRFVHDLVRQWHDEPSPEMGDYIAEQLYERFAPQIGLDVFEGVDELKKELKDV